MSLPAPLVSAHWLSERLGTPGLVIIDGSWYLPALHRDPKKEYVIVEKGLKNEKGERGNLKIKFEIIYPNRVLVPEEIIAITDIFKKYDLK